MTIFLDIDGTILYQYSNDPLDIILDRKPQALPCVITKLNEWHSKEYKIILTSCRPEGARERTIEQLHEVGIYHYDKLILGLPFGDRVLINDSPNEDIARALAYPVNRNEGLVNINL